MEKSKEKRKPIICPNCGCKMLCMNRFQSVYNLIRGFYVWYICPRRKGEHGCGHSILLKIAAKTKRPQKIIKAVKSKKR